MYENASYKSCTYIDYNINSTKVKCFVLKNVGITDKKVSLVKSRQDVLQTVTMEELYDTVYLPKVPIVDGLLYNGMYVFVGVLKVGKSFFWHS